MNRNAGMLLAALALAAQTAHADGGLFPRRPPPNGNRERTFITEPAQKAAVIYQNGRERLIISPSYQGPPGDFAWVVPVPSRPQVKILRGALFHELARIVAPPPPMPMEGGGAMAPAPARARPPVVVLERKTVGAYDVSVLSATDGGALQTWLDTNGYLMLARAKRPLADYVREGWTFVACRVKQPHNARGLQQGTLAPLSLTFSTPKIVYPMRLSAINPTKFDLLLYVLLPRGAAEPTLRGWAGVSPQIHSASIFASRREQSYPTLGGLGANIGRVLWMKAKIAPKDCTRDIVFQPR